MTSFHCTYYIAHFLKNMVSYWGLAAGLIGLHSDRMIPMSGTPYNNSSQDLATLMSFIDPSLASANERWWKEATEGKRAPDVVTAVEDWNKMYLVRRDKSVIAKNLPKKTITKKNVAPYPLELSVYETYELKFMQILDEFKRLSDNRFLTPIQRAKQRRLHKMLMSVASCMRLALIHNVLPGGGRDLTIFFSPTRKKMLKAQEKPNRCVCCKRVVKRQANNTDDNQRRNDAYENLEDRDVNDEDEDYFIVDEDESESEHQDRDDGGIAMSTYVDNKGVGEIVPIPSELCQLAGKGLRHFACESCLDNLESNCESCPLCEMLMGRLHLMNGLQDLLKKKKAAVEETKVDIKIQPEDMVIPRTIYCKHIMGGFRASAKLESIVADFEQVPKDEKVIIASFFRSSLDLLEAIFDEKKYPICRYDGDICNEDREEELERFKTRENCRILLMSVQTGGT